MATRRHSPSAATARLLLAVGAALALADASVVTLALPEILTRLDTDVEGVAAVIGVYTVVLAVAVLLAVPVRTRIGSRALGLGGMLLFAGASVACGLADSLSFLLAARAVQAIGAGAALVAAYALLHDGSRTSSDGADEATDRRPSRLWVAAAVFGTAIGPALGGALTELFDWRAIFLAQAPVGVLAALAALVPLERIGPAGADPATAAPSPAVDPFPAREPTRPVPMPAGADEPTAVHTTSPAAADAPTAVRGSAVPAGSSPTAERPLAPTAIRPAGPPAPLLRSRADRWRVGVALALVSAALTAVVFLLVLMLVSGWSMQPLAAAFAVTILPVAALIGSRIPGDPWVRACGGAGLIGAGILALTAVPTDAVAWIVLPQILAGIGMGLALPALAGELLPERSPREAARLLSLRHVGITVALLILAPITAAQLDKTVDRVQEEVTALVLDARLPPNEKLGAIRPALSSLSPEDPRGDLESSLRGEAGRFADDPEDAAVYAALIDRADDTLVSAVDAAFRPAFLITGLLALIAAGLTVPRGRREEATGAAADPTRASVTRSTAEPAAVTAATATVTPSRWTQRNPTLVAVTVCVAALAVAGSQALVSRSARPPAVVIADPCRERTLPTTGGFDGAVQDVALRGLDRAACKFGSSREALTLAIVSESAAKRYEQRYGADPRSLSTLFNGALTGGGGGAVKDVLRNLFGG